MAWFSSTLQPGIKELGKEFCWQNVSEIDRLLSRQEWLTGDSYGIADPYGLIFYAWGKRIGLPMRELSSYTGFKDRMLGRPNVQTILREENSILLDAA
jgi:glutathione S-transferase